MSTAPSVESWTRAHRVLFDYLGHDDFAVELANAFAEKMDAEGWPDLSPEQLDAWIDHKQRERLSPEAYRSWRNVATAIKRVRAGMPMTPDPLSNLPEKPAND